MSRREDVDSTLAAIDGALADAEFPDAMRWSPKPKTVRAPAPFDGELVWQPPQRYEDSPLDRGVIRSSAFRLTRLDEDGNPVGEPRSIPGGYVSITYSNPWPSGDTSAMRRASDLIRARDRVLARTERRGPMADLAIFDEVYLVDPAHREEVRAARQEAAQRIVRSIGEWFTDLAAAATSVIEEFGKAFAAITPTPPRSLRETDPRAYALQLRQTRGTGPDRQVQHQHRPRRH